MFSPKPEGIAKITTLLKNSTCADNDTLRHVKKELEELALNVPDFTCYLAFLLADHSLPVSLREISGITLRGVLVRQSNVPEYVQQVVINMLDDVLSVAKVAGSLVATLISENKLPHGLSAVMAKLDSPKYFAALHCLEKICMDIHTTLQDDLVTLSAILQHVVPLMTNSDEPTALIALNIYSSFLHKHVDSFPLFYNNLILMTNCKSSEVQCAVCSAFNDILRHKAKVIENQLPRVVEYMMACTTSIDEEVAHVASECWLIFSKGPCSHVLIPYLPQLVKILFNHLIYSDAEIKDMGNDLIDDNNLPDDNSNINPMHATTWDSDDDFSDVLKETSIRKTSAAILESFATTFGLKFAELLYPLVDSTRGKDWRLRESGLLALGTLGGGNLDAVSVLVPKICPILIESLCAEPLVRSISCWSLSQFFYWIVYNDNPFLDACIKGILSNMRCKNKRVQEASCTALCNLLEVAGLNILAFVPSIVVTISSCLRIYQRRNILQLYTCISYLADGIKHELNNPIYTCALLPFIFDRWALLSDDDHELIALMECIGYLAISLGSTLKPYTPTLFSRGLQIIDSVLSFAPPDSYSEKEIVVVSLDLLSGLVKGLDGESSALISAYKAQTLQCISVCVADSDFDVKRAAIGLLGAIICNCYSVVAEYTRLFIQTCLTYVQISTGYWDSEVYGNAIWVLGEATSRMGPDLYDTVPEIVARLVHVFCAEFKPNSRNDVAEKCAVALGRFGNTDASAVANRLPDFIQQWCLQIIHVKESQEKEASFFGMLQAIKLAPKAVLPAFEHFCSAATRLRPSRRETEVELGTVVMAFKNYLQKDWTAYYAKLSPFVAHLMVTRFGC